MGKAWDIGVRDEYDLYKAVQDGRLTLDDLSPEGKATYNKMVPAMSQSTIKTKETSPVIQTIDSYKPQGLLGDIETSKPYRAIIGNPEEGFSIGDMFDAATMSNPVMSTLAAGKAIGKGAQGVSKIASIMDKAWGKVPTAARIPIGLGAGVTAVETVRGATTPGYAEQRETLPSELGASLRAGTGDVVNTAGQVAKWKGADGLGDSLIDAGDTLKKGYELAPEEFSWKSFFNPDFYAKNVARSVPFTASLIPAMYAGYRLGGVAGGRMGVGAFGKSVLGSIGGAAVSRPLESAMEAGNTYEEAIAKGLSYEEADKAAQEVFKNNLKMMGADALQLAVAFAPATAIGQRFTAKALSKGAKKNSNRSW